MNGETHFFMIAISFVMSVTCAPGNIFLMANMRFVFLWRDFHTSPNWLKAGNKGRVGGQFVVLFGYTLGLPESLLAVAIVEAIINGIRWKVMAYPLPMRSRSSNSASGLEMAVEAMI